MRAAALAVVALLAAGAARGQDMLADAAQVRPGETLMDIARAHGLGYVEMVAANPGLDPWLPPAGASVVLPTTHIAPAGLESAGLMVNLGDMRLYRLRPDGTADSFAVGIGREGVGLSAGTRTRVTGKRRAPTWVPPPSVRAEKPWLPARVPPGPDNPLGDHSLDLAIGLIRIHGTNLPDGVGRRVSFGCIRLYPEDIAALFEAVAVGTSVLFVDEPVKLAWVDDELYLEAHPTTAQADSAEDRLTLPDSGQAEAVLHAVAIFAGDRAERVDWPIVAQAERERRGIPIRVTRPTAGPPVALVPDDPS